MLQKVEEDLESEEKLKQSEEIIPQEFTVKHPLQNTWTLWFFENDKSKAWEENQRQIISFDTIEDFWRCVQILASFKVFPAKD